MLLATELFFALASALLAIAALKGSIKAWRLQTNPIDLAMRFLASIWLVYLLMGIFALMVTSGLTVLAPLPAFVAVASHAFLLTGLAFFILTAAGAVRSWLVGVLGLQLVGALLVETWLTSRGPVSPESQLLMLVFPLLTAAVVTSAVMQQVRRTQSRRSWLVLAACAMGLGLWLHQASAGKTPLGDLPVVYHLYGFVMFVVWKLISLNADADKTLAQAGTSFDGPSNLQTFASVKSDDDFISLALRGERQRISYELHDNVGSQIVSILFSMQAADQPQKRLVMLSLEQCLSDLKMMVDALDSFDENVTQALGRLRYRIQQALDRQGVTMHWEVDMSPELEAVQGIYAQQVLRIAQESLANVMRHSKASAVKVTCRFVPEFFHLVLEVWDNGIGFTPEKMSSPSGRGLESMRRRAAAVGGHLHIASRSNAGACVRLTLPLPQLKRHQKQPVVPPAEVTPPA